MFQCTPFVRSTLTFTVSPVELNKYKGQTLGEILSDCTSILLARYLYM